MQQFTLQNEMLRLIVSNLGASWLSCQVKMPQGWREVLVTTTTERWQENTAYFGATIGRYANRIANGRYCLNGETFQLSQNNDKNTLHGGALGADKKIWQVEKVSEQAVCFSTFFANGENGFGGEVKTNVTYRLNGPVVEIDFDAETSQDTPLCLTNHAYFNLSGEPTIHRHQLQIAATHYLPVAENGIPNGELKGVENTGFDFRKPKMLGQDLLLDTDQQRVKGYDHAFALVKNPSNTVACCLSVEDLTLELSTGMPALQVYSGNWLGGQPNLNGGCYADYAGIALEPGVFPDTPNHPEWWEYGGITRAGQRYQEYIHYRFTPSSIG